MIKCLDNYVSFGEYKVTGTIRFYGLQILHYPGHANVVSPYG